MNHPDLSERLERARELIKTVRHAALATVNEDGSPHNSPVFAGLDDGLHLYWSSHPEAMHSKNIARTGQVFIALFNSMDKGGGVYIQAQATPLEGEDLIEGLAIFNKARERHLREEVPLKVFQDEAMQRLYCAKPEKIWVNMAARNAEGYVIRDNRYQVSIEDLQ